MPGLVIKDLPAPLRHKLKERASRHHRGMSNAALVVLEWALSEGAPLEAAAPALKGRFARTDKFIARARRGAVRTSKGQGAIPTALGRRQVLRPAATWN
jgi:plasmid stability protein